MLRNRRLRPRRARPYRRRGVKKTGKRTNRLKKTIQKVLNKNLETKYRAIELNDGYVYGNIEGSYGAGGNPAAGNQLFNIIPTINQGNPTATVTAHGRVGNRINPIRMVTTIQYYFQGNGLVSTQDLSGVALSGLYEVRQFVATPKSFKSSLAFDGLASTRQADVLGRLLEVGNGTSVPANSAYPMNLNYPISNENWSVHSGNKKFIMGKNSGLMNSGGYNPLTTARAVNTIRFTTKLPKVLIYNENEDVLPTNAIALWGCYAGILQNHIYGASVSYDQLLDTTSLSGTPKHPILRWNLRSELWYKDA